MIFWLLPLLFFFSADVDVDAVESISHQNKTARQVGHVISSESTEVSFLSFDFIFGFSTGHVGTTSLSDGKLYGHPDHVVFLHESNFGKFHIQNMAKGKWLQSTKAEVDAYVKQVYYPFLLKCRGHKQTLLDLGHHNLYFIDSLIEHLEENNARYLMVRIRRERLESAVSLSFNTPTLQYKDLCGPAGLLYRYCPFDKPDEVILRPPTKEVWNKFTVFQQALWMGDEVEARWNRILSRHPSMRKLELMWGKRWPGSLDLAAKAIANALGVFSNVEYKDKWPVGHAHAGDDDESDVRNVKFAVEDRIYRRAMKYKYLPG